MLLSRLGDNGFWLGIGVLIILLSRKSSLAQGTPNSLTAISRNRKDLREFGTPCGPDCLLCSSSSVDFVQLPACERCEPGFEIDVDGQCKRTECDAAPHCMKCSEEECMECLPGYILSAGFCLDQLGLIYGTSQEGSLDSNSYYRQYDDDDAMETFRIWRVLIAGLVVLPCGILYAIRGLQRHRRPVPVEILLHRVPAVVVASSQSDNRSDGRGAEHARVEESEAAPLLSSSGVDAVKPSNAVVVVDPTGNIEVGVQQEQADGNEHPEP